MRRRSSLAVLLVGAAFAAAAGSARAQDYVVDLTAGRAAAPSLPLSFGEVTIGGVPVAVGMDAGAAADGAPQLGAAAAIGADVTVRLGPTLHQEAAGLLLFTPSARFRDGAPAAASSEVGLGVTGQLRLADGLKLTGTLGWRGPREEAPAAAAPADRSSLLFGGLGLGWSF